MTFIIGIDPGPVVGMCLLRLPNTASRPGFWYSELAMVSPGCVSSLIGGWVEAYNVTAVAAEAFVDSKLGSRANDRAASQEARDVLTRLRPTHVTTARRWRWLERRAVDINGWATDARLNAAGLLVPSKNMRHARSALRHALYAACHDFGARVPRTPVGAGARERVRTDAAPMDGTTVAMPWVPEDGPAIGHVCSRGCDHA